jgi:hypothetical protein
MKTYAITYEVVVNTADETPLEEAADAVSMQLWELGLEWDGDIVTESASLVYGVEVAR